VEAALTVLAVIAAFAILIAFGPYVFLRRWSWRDKIEAFRARRGR
jgi:hypothetical protein